eukprot:Skav214047  [mRNA]  locus=scaffold2017:330466:335429:+ [translate_table: standard]
MEADVVANFERWCHEHACVKEKVQVSTTAFGLGLSATKDVEAEEVAVSIPLGLVLTVAQAARSTIGRELLRRKTTSNVRVSAQALMYVVMIHGWHDASSKWHPYLRQMPSKHGDPMCWTAEERQKRLRGTQLLHEVERHEAQLRSVYSSLFPALSQELPEMFPGEHYTFSAFIWARSSLASRCFAETHLNDFLQPCGDIVPEEATKSLRLSSEDAERLTLDCPGILCPLLDTGNHDPSVTIDVGLCRAADGFHLGLARKTAVAAGKEYFINYGNHRSNLQLLLGHGFCVPENPQDTVKVDPSAELQVLSIFQQELLKKQEAIASNEHQSETPQRGDAENLSWRCDYAALYRYGQLDIIKAALNEAKTRANAFIEANNIDMEDGEEGEEEEGTEDDEVVDPSAKKSRIA